MANSIKKIAVIGAGVMGAGLAALVANSSHKVVLLDIVDKTNPSDRNYLLKKSLKRINTQKPLSLAHPDKLKLITIGNLEDNLELLKSCDLVIEAIAEKIEIKQELYNKIAPYLKNDSCLVSNTSTIKLSLLKETLPSFLQARFLIAHFFNPPRHMDLVEIISDNHNNKIMVEAVICFIQDKLGKTIVRCNDTPGFIANRVGCFLLELVARKAIDQKLNITVIDDIFVNLFNFPKTGIFGLYDLIGHDVMHLISHSLLKELPKEDAYHDIYIKSPLLDLLREKNHIGKKAGKGFYNDKKQYLSFDNSKEIIYEDIKIDEKFENITTLLKGHGKYSLFFNAIFKKFYRYLFSLLPSVTNDPKNIDIAMKLGYSWPVGPFQLLMNNFVKIWLNDQTIKMPPLFSTEASSAFELPDYSIIFTHDSASLEEFESAFLFRIKTKMGILNIEIFNSLLRSLDLAEKKNKNLIIASETTYFSAGADLKFIKNSIRAKDFKAIDNFLALGQEVMQRLKYSSIKVVSCANGIALGGGLKYYCNLTLL